ncbi:DUF6907 domain-containing protein [Streptomyces sp. NPDC002467]|uniref:DUF6907 domain-containing protein n=1 Tax=Streptomyces sp. NPDC002467 TaxID=3364647 RepID=UPI003675E5A8
MSNTVAARVKPAEGDAPQTAPQTNDRTITYPLVGGGFLAAPCPSWCTSDHSDDVERGIHPGELLHQGDEVALAFELPDGTSTRVLAVRIEQYPFAHDGESDRPHACLVPSEDDGECTGYLSAMDLNAEIRRAEKHLFQLRKLSERLAEAAVEEHAGRHQSLAALDRKPNVGTWMSLRLDDVATMPVHYLLKAFAATVVEVDSPDEGALVEHLLAHPDGTHTLNLDRRLTQVMREQSTRQLLANRLYTRR